MRRVVRDTCLRTGKEADLVLVGEDTEIDKALVDRLHDPLVHVLRNAIDHGLEMPDERTGCGKSRRGRVVLQAAHRGGAVEIVVGDDGAGVNIARVKARAIERGLCAEEAVLSDEAVIEFLFAPGFSTAAQVTELSGRGVGLDVMRSTIESMRGSVCIRSKAGVGMRIEILLPLTVAFLEAMVVRAHGWLLAVPIEKVHHVERLAEDRIISEPGSDTVLARLDDGLVPLVRLSRFFNSVEDEQQSGSPIVVVVNSQRGRIAFPVDKLVGNQQVMLKPMNGLLQNIRASSGYGVLRSGEVALTLDCERLHAS
jgi:two-component system chemotaxis sensor kinase CheA